MRCVFLFVIIISLFGCNKQGEYFSNEPSPFKDAIHLSSETGQDLFKSDPDLLQQISALVKNFDDNEAVVKIDKVSYFEMENSQLALVYYYSNYGYSNIAIVKYDEGEAGVGQHGQGYEMKCSGNCSEGNCMAVQVLNENGAS